MNINITSKLNILNNINECLDDGINVVGVFLDLSKAFDLVDLIIIIIKQEAYQGNFSNRS